MKEAENLTKNISFLLKKMEKDVKWLSNRDGDENLSPNTIYSLLKPDANPKLKTLKKVAEILNVSIEWLLQEHDFAASRHSIKN